MAQHVHIIGAGLSGLTAAHDFLKDGRQVTVLEAEDYVGGLAASFDIGDGFTVDLGPHRFHTTNKSILDHVDNALKGNVNFRDRLSRIWMMGKFFNYPLKSSNVVRNMPFTFLVKALIGYVYVRIRDRFKPIQDTNFENYMVKRFGRPLYEVFFGEYTEKAWGIPCSQISADWAAQRITLLNLWDTIKKTLFRPKNTPRTLVSKFRYPLEGGIGALSEGYRRDIEAMGGRIITGAPVVKLKSSGNKITEIHYRHQGEIVVEKTDDVLNTMPVTELMKRFDPAVPEDVTRANDALVHKAIVFVYLKLNREKVTDDHWIYIPEKAVRVHRISEFKNFSEKTCPQGKTALCAEITCTKEDDTWNMSDEDLIELATRDLEQVGLIAHEEVFGGSVIRTDFAYPIYDLTYRKNLQHILAHVKTYENLDTTGRQGLFRYNNMDHSVAMGMKVARVRNREEHAKVGTESEYFG